MHLGDRTVKKCKGMMAAQVRMVVALEVGRRARWVAKTWS